MTENDGKYSIHVGEYLKTLCCLRHFADEKWRKKWASDVDSVRKGPLLSIDHL